MEAEKEIECHLCGGKALLQFEELVLSEGRVVIRQSPFYACQKCKEKFSTSGQMHELSHLLNQTFFFTRPIIHAGRSLAVTFPADLVQFSNLKKGEKIRIIPEGKREWRIQITN